MVIGTDCTGSCKSNYHTITTTTVSDLIRNERCENSDAELNFFFSKNEEPQSWMGYFGQALKTSATYLPTQVTEMFNQGRAFATARLPSSGLINVCALSV